MTWALSLCPSTGRWGMVRPPRCPAPSPTPAPRLLPSLPGVTWAGKTFRTCRLSMASRGQHPPWASSLPGRTTTSSYGVASDTRVGSSSKTQRCFSKSSVSMQLPLIWENTERTWFFSVLTDVPEIRNVSHCTSGAKLITCVCIVESNPSSRLQFVLSDRILNSTMVKTNGTVTTGLLRVEQRPHTFIQCLASNTLGRANLTLSVTLLHSNVFF